jgi:prophage regulatory protein
MDQAKSSLQNEVSTSDITFIRLKEVLAICGRSRSSVYAAIKQGAFPAPIKLSAHSTGWIKSEVLAWAASRVTASRSP